MVVVIGLVGQQAKVCGGSEQRVYAGVEGIQRCHVALLGEVFSGCLILPRKGTAGASLAGSPSQGVREHPGTPRGGVRAIQPTTLVPRAPECVVESPVLSFVYLFSKLNPQFFTSNAQF